MPATTFLFVPGDRPDRFGKAVARTHVAEWLENNRAMVRINAPGTPWFDADAALVSARGIPVVVPKAETPGVLAEAARGLERAGEPAAVPSVDGVTTDPREDETLEADVRHARRMGFAPTVAEREWARRVLTAGDSASTVDGRMVDKPVLARARRILGE